MLFHEIYSTYFQTVAKILTEAVDHPLTTGEINLIIQNNAFEESILNIPESLGVARWQLLKEDGTTILGKKPTMPLTILQKRWINAVALDPRVRLFTDHPVVFSDVEPLFLLEDIYVFDKYSDGDPYEDAEYIRNFRLILDAIKHQYPIQIRIMNRHGKQVTARTVPEYLEYSEKDDKFRLIGTGSKLGNTINLGRIISCEKCEDEQTAKPGKRNRPHPRIIIFELVDDRKALERVLMHFAYFEKQVEKIDERKYKVTLHYDKEDETEILIRVLSFGPMIRVVKPAAFINLIKDRLSEQKSCGL
ncbi:WYL domain-containing protein [Blautia sp. XA-2221]|uniref:WYL domain-containing protein n=1 Tax=Blautia sp. XA-2221 TaxID=2903961 RepID=UPI002379E5BF|nr:WYL domain-containing protein [Blautia sp. XA-2221]